MPENGQILLRPGGADAPWELQVEGDASGLAGATLTLEPLADESGLYRLAASGGEVQAHGRYVNHNPILLRD